VRITVDVPADLQAQLAAIARDTRRTLSETVVFLIRCGLGEGHTARLAVSSATGLPVVHLSKVITTEDVRALVDG
jgi:hypothetical protein